MIAAPFRALRGLLRRLGADRRGSADLNTYLLLTAAGCTMVGLTAPHLFRSSQTASSAFERQVGVLENGASTGPATATATGGWNISIGRDGVTANGSVGGAQVNVNAGQGGVTGNVSGGSAPAIAPPSPATPPFVPGGTGGTGTGAGNGSGAPNGSGGGQSQPAGNGNAGNGNGSGGNPSGIQRLLHAVTL